MVENVVNPHGPWARELVYNVALARAKVARAAAKTLKNRREQ
jgi:hypothetical protein